METEAERPAMERVEEELFSEQGPRPAGGKTTEEPPRKADPRENESTRRLSERFAKQRREQLERASREQKPDKEDGRDQSGENHFKKTG